MQPSSGGCFPSIQFFSTEAAAFVMPILFSDYCENMWTYLILNVNLVQQDATIQDIHIIYFDVWGVEGYSLAILMS
jgi:hypothetical protein